MTPTPEEIEAMAARGWEWIGVLGGFRVPPNMAIDAFIHPFRGEWCTSHGTQCETLMGAADEAEAWIRNELGKLKFPWLAVAP